MAQEATKDFFISYNKADRPWAEWMAWQLEAEGYTTVLQAWDFLPGSHFVLKMQEAASAARRTIAVLSPNYLDALYTQPEWAAAFVKDPTGQKGTLLPIRVRECTLTGILAPIVYIDLLGLAEGTARETLLAGIRRTRARPSQAPGFPGNAKPATAAKPQTPSFPGGWPSVWNVPYRRNPFFTGREALLSLLHDSLTRSGATALTHAQAISGLGGIGKTQTALEYAYRHSHLYHYVLWVSAATPAALLSDYVKLATLLEVPGRDEQDQHKTVEAVKDWLSRQRDWLLILDNADDLELAADYLPGGNSTNGYVLLTTRAQNAGAVADLVDVEKMGKDEGALLLLRRARILAQTAALEQATPKDRAGAEAIVAAMDGLPLALDQVGAYLQETSAPLTDYLRLYERRRADLLARRGRLPPGHPDTVATTWSLSFQQVEHANPAAAELLRLCAFLAPDGIPEELLSQGAADLGDVLGPVVADEYLLNGAIEVLRRYSLVRRNAETKLLSIHRLVQAVLIDTMKEEDQRLWAERAVRAVNSVFPEYIAWIETERYLSQVPGCVAMIERYGLTFPEAAYLLNRAGYSWYQRAEYEQAEPLFQRALRINEQILGPEHPSTAITVRSYAYLLRLMKREREAALLEARFRVTEKKPGSSS